MLVRDVVTLLRPGGLLYQATGVHERHWHRFVVGRLRERQPLGASPVNSPTPTTPQGQCGLVDGRRNPPSHTAWRLPVRRVGPRQRFSQCARASTPTLTVNRGFLPVAPWAVCGESVASTSSDADPTVRDCFSRVATTWETRAFHAQGPTAYPGLTKRIHRLFIRAKSHRRPAL